MGGFIYFNIEMKRVSLEKNILIGARSEGDSAYWSRYNLCDIVTNKASVTFVAPTDPEVHFKCYISADCKIQAAIKHETEAQTIHRKTWFHSSLSCSFRCT